ncbi:hypothetical protein D3C81_1689260 [compost metagenome]
MPRSQKSAGFTLIELMVVVALVVIFTTIALPSFNSMITNSRLQATNNELYSLLQFARSTAVENNTTRLICITSTQLMVKTACTDTTSLRTMEKPSGVDIASSATSITFRSNGTAASTVSLVACKGNSTANGYKLTVLASGFIRQNPRGQDGSATLSSCTP